MNKVVVFLGDGMADDPIFELGGATPLEAARTPNMDAIARDGASGTFLSLPEGLPTSSDVANMSVLGYDGFICYPGRGPIEAVSQDIPLAADDVAWRCNLVTVGGGKLLDYSAGHIEDAVSKGLIADLQREFGSASATFHPGVSYRNLLILHGAEFSANVHYEKPDSSQDMPLEDLRLRPSDDSPAARRTVEFLEELADKANAYLAAHPLNADKESPANSIWPWSPGNSPSFVPFAKKYSGARGAVISAVDVVFGIAKCAGMHIIRVPGATGFIDTNYEGKAAAAVKAIDDHDFVYLHVEAIDECGHMGDLALKIRAIEDFDARVVGPVVAALRGRGVTFAVLPDHPVPLALRAHTRTPVPVAVAGPNITPDAIDAYNEKLAPGGALGQMAGEQLVRLTLGL